MLLTQCVFSVCKEVSKLVLVILPPVPKLGYGGHIRIWKEMVSAIREWSDDDGVTVINTRDIFFHRNNFVKTYYEKNYSSGAADQIHWNEDGAEKVLSRIYNCC